MSCKVLIVVELATGHNIAITLLQAGKNTKGQLCTTSQGSALRLSPMPACLKVQAWTARACACANCVH